MTKHDWEFVECRLPEWQGIPHLHRSIWRCRRCGARCHREVHDPSAPEAQYPPGWRQMVEQKIWKNCDRQLVHTVQEE